MYSLRFKRAAAGVVLTVIILVSVSLPSAADSCIVVFSKTSGRLSGTTYSTGVTGSVDHLVADLDEGVYRVTQNGSMIGDFTCYGPARTRPDGTLGDNTIQYKSVNGGTFSVSWLRSLGDDPPPPSPVITTDGGNGPGEDYAASTTELTLQGTCAAVTASIRVNGLTSGVTYTPGSTAWSYTGGLSVGTNRFAVTSTGLTGLTSLPATISIAYGDGVPPSPPEITTDGGNGPGKDYATTSSSLFLSGTCDSATELLKVNGSTRGVTYASGATTWSYRGTLAEGVNEFAVTSTDAVGLESTPNTISVTLNTGSAVPTPEITTDGGNGPGADFVTTVPSLALTGTCDSSAATILVNGSSSGVNYVHGETIWSYGTSATDRPPTTATAFQNEGTEQADILASVSDVDGSWSPADIVPTGTVTVDYYANGRDPYYFDAISLTFPGAGLDLSNLVLKVYLQKGSATDANWEHYQLLPGQFNPTNEDTYDFVYLPADPRDYLPNGTIAAETTVGWVEIPFDATTDSAFIDGDGDIALTLRLWNWRVDAVRLGQVSEGTVPLKEGPNTFTVVAQDPSGTASDADTVVITLDTTPPASPTITTDGGNGPGSDFDTYTDSIVLAGTCDPSTRRILVNDSDSTVTYTPGNTEWQYSGWLLDGVNTFTVTAEDEMGNRSEPATINVSRVRMQIVEGAPMDIAGACCALLIAVVAVLRRNRIGRAG